MIPELAASDFLGGGASEARAAANLRSALASAGGAHLRLSEPLLTTRRTALSAARVFFAQPVAEKAALEIAGSPHHRGWSVMHNERDWREQVHLGRERRAAGAEAPPWRSLEGPNLWPPEPDGGFRAAMEAHLEACADLGQGLVEALGHVCGFGKDWGAPEQAYLLMKLIAYHPQWPGVEPRRGVAAHVDFSLLTLLAQDPSGGLEIRQTGGRWTPVEPREDCLFLNAGELLEALCGGQLRATPHRVTHRATDQARLSIPVFFNPPLEAWIHPQPTPAAGTEADGTDHVHRVLTGGEGPFRFGEAEWRRKGLNHWCAACCG